MAQMSENELKSIVSSKLHDGRDFVQDDRISRRQEQAINYYLGEPFQGRLAPQPGRSSVVAREVHDTIEWMLPSLLRPFTSTDRVVEFIPQNAEDEEAAQQETDVVNYVFSRQNQGFSILYTFFKDALFPKGGFVKTVWEDIERETTESYKRLSDEEFKELQDDPELELEEHTINENDERELQGQVFTVRSHDATFRENKQFGQVKIFNVPPEELMLHSDTTWDKIKEAKFIAHIPDEITVTDLIEMFPDRKKDIMDLSPSASIFNTDESEQLARDRDIVHADDEAALDESMRKIELIEAYIRIDFNGDGKAELRKVIMVGNEIFENEEVDSHPFSYLCSEPLTHRFWGVSIAELSSDLQEVKTPLWRNILDNIYWMNNQTVAFNKNTVNMSDISTRRIGGGIRVNGSPGAEILPVPATPMPPQAFGMLDYLDKVRQQRTGVDTGESALNPEALKNINIPVARNFFEARTAKLDLMSRLFAETGVKQMFLDIHALLRKNQNKPMIIQLRNKMVDIDPREWKERDDMMVSIGLGTGNRDIQLLQMENVLTRQAEIFQLTQGESALVDEKKVFNALSRWVEAGGQKNPEEFFNDPDKQEEEQQPEQPEQNPNLAFQQQQAQLAERALQLQQQQNEIGQQRLVIDAQKAQVQAQKEQVAAQQKQQEIELDTQKARFELEQKEAALQLKERELDIREEKGLLDVETARNKQELESGQNVPGAGV